MDRHIFHTSHNYLNKTHKNDWTYLPLLFYDRETSEQYLEQEFSMERIMLVIDHYVTYALLVSIYWLCVLIFYVLLFQF